jgi:hypothetical protein
MAHATQKLKLKSTHKPSVKFEGSKSEKYPMTNGFYLNREFAEKMLHCKDLDDVSEIEITIRIK